MSAMEAWVLLRLLLWAEKRVRKHIDSLTPEQKSEYQESLKDLMKEEPVQFNG